MKELLWKLDFFEKMFVLLQIIQLLFEWKLQLQLNLIFDQVEEMLVFLIDYKFFIEGLLLFIVLLCNLIDISDLICN